MVGIGLVALCPSPADGQRPIGGFPRSDQSDVTGPSVTSGDQLAPLFAEPGTVRSMACPVAWGVRTASDRVQVILTSGELRPSSTAVGGEIPTSAQRAVLTLLLRNEDDRSPEAVYAALTNGNSGAERQARRLVAEASGLLTVMNTLDPLRPGRAAPSQLARVTGAYNSFVDASGDAFISNPPAELLALHAVLDELVEASIQNEGRPANVADVDASGLACAGAAVAPPPVTTVVVAPPPADQPFEMCVLVNGDFRIVAGLRTPDGD